jgi:hypothetical protein
VDRCGHQAVAQERVSAVRGLDAPARRGGWMCSNGAAWRTVRISGTEPPPAVPCGPRCCSWPSLPACRPRPPVGCSPPRPPADATSTAPRSPPGPDGTRRPSPDEDPPGGPTVRHPPTGLKAAGTSGRPASAGQRRQQNRQGTSGRTGRPGLVDRGVRAVPDPASDRVPLAAVVSGGCRGFADADPCTRSRGFFREAGADHRGVVENRPSSRSPKGMARAPPSTARRCGPALTDAFRSVAQGEADHRLVPLAGSRPTG